MIEKVQFTVGSADSGERLDLFLTKHLSGYSRSQIQKLIADDNVLLKGNVVPKNTRLSENDLIDVIKNSSFYNTAPIKPQNISFDIIYEDEYIVAVNKPAGLVVHPGNGVHDGTLVNGLVNRLKNISDGFCAERPGIVHRLDKETSGVLIVAKTNQAHCAMASLFQNRFIDKRYVAFCLGVPSELSGKIDLPLDRSHKDPIKRAPSVNGKVARTEYVVIQQKGGVAAICFKPLTGRTHQIRVHASAKGFPIIADKLYGGGSERLYRLNPLDRAFAYSILKTFTRHALHAFSITFMHPFLQKELNIKAPIPEDFAQASLKFGSTQLFEKYFSTIC